MQTPRGITPHRRPADGHRYLPGYLSARDRAEILRWISTLHPLWEYRHAPVQGGTTEREARRLLRPVYWLGSWQFACLDYYRPPKHTRDRCVAAEPFPPVLDRLARDMETRLRRMFNGPDIPGGFRLNTCLVNLYGSRLVEGRWVDGARVGEHRDFEPGPVASLSIGERAFFQFVTSRHRGEPSRAVLSQWLDDGSLQLFGGSFYKDRVFHRVQRVDRREGIELPPQVEGFRTRRINFTFRYVPAEHIVPFRGLGVPARDVVEGYVRELAKHSDFFARALR